MTTTKQFAIWPLCSAALTALVTVIGPTPAQAAPQGCIEGYVWREARVGDTVCVTPEVQARTAQENATAAERREPGGGPYGPNTCKQGFVWREAFDGDVVCVTPDIREQTWADNAAASSRKQATTDPKGPNFAILSPPDCYVVLDGAGPGSDTLGVGFWLQTLGPAYPDKLIPVGAAMDTGESTSLNTFPQQGTALSYAQFTVDSGNFYRRNHRLTITADPNNEYVERVESDNSFVVLIPAQPRPSNSQVPLNCQVES